MRHLTTTLATILLCGSALVATGQTTADTTAPKADNTKVNKRDRNGGEPTADNQKMNANDRDITRNIRKSIVADKSLSTYAHNVKIISQNGAVTLKGPVKTEEEKKAVMEKAVAVAGSADKVTDEMSVAASR